jgi:hypothetical protein
VRTEYIQDAGPVVLIPPTFPSNFEKGIPNVSEFNRFWQEAKEPRRKAAQKVAMIILDDRKFLLQSPS